MSRSQCTAAMEHQIGELVFTRSTCRFLHPRTSRQSADCWQTPAPPAPSAGGSSGRTHGHADTRRLVLGRDTTCCRREVRFEEMKEKKEKKEKKEMEGGEGEGRRRRRRKEEKAKDGGEGEGRRRRWKEKEGGEGEEGDGRRRRRRKEEKAKEGGEGEERRRRRTKEEKANEGGEGEGEGVVVEEHYRQCKNSLIEPQLSMCSNASPLTTKLVFIEFSSLASSFVSSVLALFPLLALSSSAPSAPSASLATLRSSETTCVQANFFFSSNFAMKTR
eukprot:754406-Hanusia_phi.AAC.3